MLEINILGPVLLFSGQAPKMLEMKLHLPMSLAKPQKHDAQNNANK